jgi:hypothetical protein
MKDKVIFVITNKGRLTISYPAFTSLDSAKTYIISNKLTGRSVISLILRA